MLASKLGDLNKLDYWDKILIMLMDIHKNQVSRAIEARIISQPHDMTQEELEKIVRNSCFTLGYSDLASMLYQKIIHNPESNYNAILYQSEIDLLKFFKQHNETSNPNLLYIGCSDFYKGEILLGGGITHCIGTDFSNENIVKARKRLSSNSDIQLTMFGDDNFKDFDMLNIKETILKAKSIAQGPLTILFAGSTILNMDDEQIKNFFSQCKEAMSKEDELLISYFNRIDTKNSNMDHDAIIDKFYTDPYNNPYSYAFCMESANVLPINDTLWKYIVEFNRDKSRIELYIEPRRDIIGNDKKKLFNVPEKSKPIFAELLGKKILMGYSRREDINFFQNMLCNSGLYIKSATSNTVSTILKISGQNTGITTTTDPNSVNINHLLQISTNNPTTLLNLHERIKGLKITRKEAITFVKQNVLGEPTDSSTSTTLEIFAILLSNIGERCEYILHTVQGYDGLVIIQRRQTHSDGLDQFFCLYKTLSGDILGTEVGKLYNNYGGVEVQKINIVGSNIRIETNKGFLIKDI